MTRRQAQALEVVRLAIDAARKTDLTDDQIFGAINLPIYFHRVTAGTKPKKYAIRKTSSGEVNTWARNGTSVVGIHA
jgi:hypothetical protein